jgi:hypothetical protein
MIQNSAPMTEAAPQAFLPARRAPLLYFGFAHACLLVALGTLALRADELGGFYYHPRLIAVVHLVTLGFITSAILGALYLVCPLAFRLPLPERRIDLAASLTWMLGVSGIASHFWLESYTGMAWSGALALATPLWLGGRVLAGLRHAPVPLEARLPVALAILNFYLAAGLGVMLGIHKHQPFLPFTQLDGVHSHVHLAALGFATLTVVGVGYRMLPMVLPAAMPRGPLALASGLVLEVGALGLGFAFLFAKPLVPAFALVTLAGLGLFFSRVAYMLRNRRPAPSERPRPDWAVLHAISALGCLAITAGIGLALAWLQQSDATLQLVFAYGVVGFLGFFCQLVVGVEARLVPLAAWLQGFATGGYREMPASLHHTPSRGGAAATFALWTLGVPSLALGLALDRPAWTSSGAFALALAVLIVSVSGTRTLLRLRVPPAGGRAAAV